jgi:hypothetical protein
LCCCFYFVLFKAHESKSVQTSAGKQLEGVEALGSGAGNKKKMFEDKVGICSCLLIIVCLFVFQAHESKSVQTAAGKQLYGIESVGASNKMKMFEQKVRFVCV